MNLRFFVAVDKRFEYTCTKGKPYSGTSGKAWKRKTKKYLEERLYC
jgi:hypothetical protein